MVRSAGYFVLRTDIFISLVVYTSVLLCITPQARPLEVKSKAVDDGAPYPKVMVAALATTGKSVGIVIG